ncbi:MAG: hypothetical protein JWR44_99 [Hymenobacter sp.]|jgi:GAF domain-containing protein|nr:hypothetical protein [Hymenobacter sp.]
MSTSAALLPPDEAERLRTLRHYNFLAAPPEDVFYNLVGLAAEVFDQPVSFIALVDEHEVRFPVRHGNFDMPSVPRAQALCSSAILHPHAVAYENLAAATQTGPDAPAIRAALAQGNGFYAAAPLCMPDGRPIGVLCLAGPEPRSFGPDEEEVLEAIADVTSLAIAVRHLCLATPELGTDQWPAMRRHLCHDLEALRTQMQELLSRHGRHIPVSTSVLAPVQLGLQGLRMVLVE